MPADPSQLRGELAHGGKWSLSARAHGLLSSGNDMRRGARRRRISLICALVAAGWLQFQPATAWGAPRTDVSSWRTLGRVMIAPAIVFSFAVGVGYFVSRDGTSTNASSARSKAASTRLRTTLDAAAATPTRPATNVAPGKTALGLKNYQRRQRAMKRLRRVYRPR